MQGLHGDFQTFPPRSLLLHCAARRASGKLICTRGTLLRTFVLEQGEMISGSSSERREFLGQFLINLGLLDEETLLKAFHFQKQTGTPLGWVLANSGLVSEVAVRGALSFKLRESLLDVLMWQEGHFELVAEERRTGDALQIQLPLSSLLAEMDLREVAWLGIRAVFRDASQRVQALEPSPPSLEGSFEHRLFELCKGAPTVQELVEVLRAPDFHVFSSLLTLYRAGALVLVDDEPATLVGERAQAGEVIARARAWLAEGRVADAWKLAALAVELDPANQEAAALAGQCQERHLELLRAEISSGLAVRLLVDKERLRDLPLTARERFLLSRVDGKRTLSAILSISPLQERDVLLAFKRFVAENMVAFE